MIIFNQPVRPAREVTGQELEDLIESLGGHAAVRDGILRYGERCDLFDSRRAEFTAKYPDHFVALASDDTVLASETLQGVFEEIDRRGLHRGDCVVKYVAAKPEVWIL